MGFHFRDLYNFDLIIFHHLPISIIILLLRQKAVVDPLFLQSICVLLHRIAW